MTQPALSHVVNVWAGRVERSQSGPRSKNQTAKCGVE